MSLDDKFNPNDGSLIDRIDNAMIGFHKKLGNFWQNKTHKSVDGLKRGLYGSSAITLIAHSIVGPNYIMLIPALSNGMAAVTSRENCPKTSLDSEIQSEAIGLPKKFFKYTHAILYGLGAISTLTRATEIIAGAISGDYGLIKEGLDNIGYGIGVLSWITANYLHQTDFNPPPPKPKKKPILERIKIGKLLPQPIPVSSR